MASPNVSIVLPTHNGSRYIDQAIRACLDQTYSNWELIIVDDASTDDTPDKVSKYDDPRILVIRHEVNQRLPGALNTGFARARGKYLTWTSDDNMYLPAALERMVAFLERHPDVAVVHADFSVIDADSNLIASRRVSGRDDLLRGECIGPCFLYRREVQETVGGYSRDMFLAEDYDFWLRASVSFRFAEVHEDLYRYRMHKTSLTSTYSQGRVRQTIHDALQRNLSSIHWVGPGMKRYYLSRGWVSVGNAHYVELRFGAAWAAWREAMKLDLSVMNPQLLFVMVKSLLGARQIGWARRRKRTLVGVESNSP